MGTNNIGIYFSDFKPPPTIPPYIFNLNPQVFTNIINTDTANWTLISGTYIANGGEQYITIGNFFTNANTDTLHISNNNQLSYYYIDDVSVTCCDCEPDSLSNLTIPNIFTPNGDGENDVFKVISKNIKIFNCKIYNRWGTLITELKDANESWDGKNTTAGVYYYIISAEGIDEKKYNQKGFVEVIK